MKVSKIKERILALLEELGIPTAEIADSDDLGNHGMDSLDMVELIIEIEKEFSINITDDVAADQKTIAGLVLLVAQLTENSKELS